MVGLAAGQKKRCARADRAGVTLLAARLAEGVAGIEYDDDRPDLSEYDIAFTADVGVQEGGR